MQEEIKEYEELENLADHSVYNNVCMPECGRKVPGHESGASHVGRFIRHGTVRVYGRSGVRRDGRLSRKSRVQRGESFFGSLCADQHCFRRYRRGRGAQELVRSVLRLYEGRFSCHAHSAGRVCAAESAALRWLHRKQMGRRRDQLSHGQGMAGFVVLHSWPVGA